METKLWNKSTLLTEKNEVEEKKVEDDVNYHKTKSWDYYLECRGLGRTGIKAIGKRGQKEYISS